MNEAENDKLAEVTNDAEKRGYVLSGDAEKIIKAMFKKEKKLGGLYCPCMNIALMEENEKKNYTCPCIDLEKDVKENGKCFCGLFVKKEKKNETS